MSIAYFLSISDIRAHDLLNAIQTFSRPSYTPYFFLSIKALWKDFAFNYPMSSVEEPKKRG